MIDKLNLKKKQLGRTVSMLGETSLELQRSEIQVEKEIRHKREQLLQEIEKLFHNSLRDVKLQVLLRQDQVKDRQRAMT